MPTYESRMQGVLSVAHYDYEKGMNIHAYNKLHSHDLGEDLVQDTFLKTWKYLSKGGDVHIMKAFLYHILNNLIIDEYRKHKPVSLDCMLEAGFDVGVDTNDASINVLDGHHVLYLIKYLPLRYQTVILQRYVEELSLKEMSACSCQTQNAIAVQVYRGIEKLKVLHLLHPSELVGHKIFCNTIPPQPSSGI